LRGKFYRERLDAFHKLLLGIILHGPYVPCMGSGATARVGRYERMEQRRFFEVRGEESGEWLVLDAKRHPLNFPNGAVAAPCSTGRARACRR
jgi:hypothetical protein